MTTISATAPRTALLLVDVQNDFCPSGALAVDGGDTVATGLARYIADTAGHYGQLIASQDWHIDPGEHFSETPDYVDSWPVHCVAESQGAQLHPELLDIKFDELFRKGEYTAAYSATEGHAVSDSSLLVDWLHNHGVTSVDVAGLATDHCVKATVLGLRDAGLNVRVLTQLCAGVDGTASEQAFDVMKAAGAELV